MELCSAPALAFELEHMCLATVDLDVIRIHHVLEQTELGGDNAVSNQATRLLMWHASDEPSPIIFSNTQVDLIRRSLEAELSQPSLLCTGCLSALARREGGRRQIRLAEQDSRLCSTG